MPRILALAKALSIVVLKSAQASRIMETDPRQASVEVLPPERVLLARREQSAMVALRAFLFSSASCIPVEPPTFTRTDCEGSFAHRFGIAVIASWRWFQFYLSPSGDFSAFLKVFLRWFIVLLALVLLIVIPAVIAINKTSARRTMNQRRKT